MKTIQGSNSSTHIALLGLIGFFVLASYAIARPAIDSLYIEAFTAQNLPYAWLGVGVVATITVLLYGRLTAAMELTHVLRLAIYASILILVGFMIWARTGSRWAIFCLYIWKDIYIVVLIEMFWSIANSLFVLKTAKWVYGLFCVIGSLGGVTANLAIGPIAKSIGTANAPWLVLPILAVCAVAAYFLPPVSAPSREEAEKADFWVGLRVIRKSRYLGLLLGVIALTQIAITLIDFEFNRVLEGAYPDQDDRTAMIGQVYAAIDTVSLGLQLGAGVVISLLGVGGTLLGIPLVLASCIGVFLAIPSVTLMAVTKVCSKALDYSIFRAAKELLYLPLNHGEKTQGKAVVDMLTYRLAKGAASVGIIGLAAFQSDPVVITVATLIIVLSWLGVTWLIIPRYHERRESRESVD